MLKIRISPDDEYEFRKFLFSKGFFWGAKAFLIQMFYILKEYIKLSKEEKEKVFIGIHYNAVDDPILTLRYKR